MLRGKIVRLAYKNPGFRSRLLPILKVAEITWKKTMVGTKVRVRWADHPQNVAMIEELPGKPLKRQVGVARIDTSLLLHWIHGSSSFLMSNIMQDFKFSENMSFDQAVAEMRGAMEKAKATAIDETTEAAEKYPGRYEAVNEAWFAKMRWMDGFFSLSQKSYLEVEPADYKTITLRGKDFGGKFEWGKFEFWADKDKDDYMDYMEGMRAFYSSKSPGGARKLFKWLKVNEEKASAMGLDDFKNFLDQNKIAFQYTPTVWR